MGPIPIDADGRFAGYASVFNLPDDSGDVVMPGAFAKSLTRRNANRVRLLFQHDPKEPVGVWETIAEDGFGLWVEGRLVAGVPRADALRALIERRAIDGLSIGFRTIRATRSKPGGQRQLWQIDLWEISIVTFPMMDGARIAQAPRPATGAAIAAAISALRQP
ncbi:HK97 family phage prohead protease [Devosia rhodophyticola]|uniref:HK97 family phage prohead protease n=1 Tax=Devosia rhodophyticola TaxID=3026423 RepID=A0ABY7Z1U7_9HYPH|nr:HK97 family phage prohead protease [Devosia rhodophyticola]WDR07457.1 HK97 family phage prohead protease [Devosia rhodophyticola]